MRRKAEERRQLLEYARYQERTATPSADSTEVPSDQEEQPAALRVKAEDYHKSKRETKEEPEEEDKREHGLKDVEFRNEPQSSNPTAASSRNPRLTRVPLCLHYEQYIPRQCDQNVVHRRRQKLAPSK